MIRRAVFNDTPHLVDLVSNYYRIKKISVDDDRLFDLIDGQIRDCTTFVYEDDGKVEGVIALTIGTNGLTGESQIKKNHWLVSPDASGHGLELLRYAEEYARDAGIKAILVGVEDERASSLMEKRGYAPYEMHFRKEL